MSLTAPICRRCCIRLKEWCAIAHLRLSSFRVRSCEPPRNDDGGVARDESAFAAATTSPMDSPAAQVASDSTVKQPEASTHSPAAQSRPGRADARPQIDRGRREDRVPATAPTAPAQKGLRERALTTGTGGNHAGLPCAVALRLIRDLLGEPSRLPPSSPRDLWSRART